MNIRLEDVSPLNFEQVIKLISDKDQEQKIQIFERWVGSNAYFLGVCYTYKFKARAIYDGETIIGFACHGLNPDNQRFELVSIMLGYQYQGKGYGVPCIKLVINEMIQHYKCNEIYITVIHDNVAAIRLYEKVGFVATGEVEKAFHDEPVYKLVVS
ncbi:GNAT family N-acetyltransferase [Cohnella abietis]|uniref:N-acetyltransferase n=1 Tax=Cohnella abietis TaxID=2507935 RepID=A0A3T1D713_9BACL|nr:GNAT family protein [Cohnella abietis]BBI33863.1 N-acetyltransferase [Cohnella abietis]